MTLALYYCDGCHIAWGDARPPKDGRTSLCPLCFEPTEGDARMADHVRYILDGGDSVVDIAPAEGWDE